ncbi:hypothetical protein D3C81_1026730 [compost metagenome]
MKCTVGLLGLLNPMDQLYLALRFEQYGLIILLIWLNTVLAAGSRGIQPQRTNMLRF